MQYQKIGKPEKSLWKLVMERVYTKKDGKNQVILPLAEGMVS